MGEETTTRKGLGTWKGGDREEKVQRGRRGEGTEQTAGMGRVEGTEDTEGAGMEGEGMG